MKIYQICSNLWVPMCVSSTVVTSGESLCNYVCCMCWAKRSEVPRAVCVICAEQKIKNGDAMIKKYKRL